MNNVLSEPVEVYNQVGLGFSNFVSARKLSPILKWAGGKEQELKYILPNLPPEKFTNYYEPFVGGGAVYTSVQAEKYFINDKSDELIALYRSLSNENSQFFFNELEKLINHWDVLTSIIQSNKYFFIEIYKKYSIEIISSDIMQKSIFEFVSLYSDQFYGMFTNTFGFNAENFIREIKLNLIRKIKRMKEIEKSKNTLPDNDILDNIETAVKSAFYMHIRYIYNNIKKHKINESHRSAIFLFIRNFAYSGMFRYNSKGEFNVPYGGIAYNRKNFQKKVDYLKTKELKSLLAKTTIENEDFEVFLEKYKPSKNDFIFLDPPYDSEFSTYAKNEFTKKDQERLAKYLLNNCNAKWMMIIKNTDFVFELYNEKGLNIKSFDKTYLVSFMNRNEKNVTHLLITNY